MTDPTHKEELQRSQPGQSNAPGAQTAEAGGGQTVPDHTAGSGGNAATASGVTPAGTPRLGPAEAGGGGPGGTTGGGGAADASSQTSASLGKGAAATGTEGERALNQSPLKADTHTAPAPSASTDDTATGHGDTGSGRAQ